MSDKKAKEVNLDDAFVGVFEAGVKAGHDDNTIKMALLKSGAKFSNVNAMYNKLMINSGLRLNRADKLAIIDTACSGADLTVETVFDDAVSDIAADAKVSVKSASGLIRSWAKSNGSECFAKPRGGNGQGQTGFASLFYKFIEKNPISTDASVNEYINEQPDRPEGAAVSNNVIKHASHYRGIANLARKIANQYAGTQKVGAK